MLLILFLAKIIEPDFGIIKGIQYSGTFYIESIYIPVYIFLIQFGAITLATKLAQTINLRGYLASR